MTVSLFCPLFFNTFLSVLDPVFLDPDPASENTDPDPASETRIRIQPQRTWIRLQDAVKKSVENLYKFSHLKKSVERFIGGEFTLYGLLDLVRGFFKVL